MFFFLFRWMNAEQWIDKKLISHLYKNPSLSLIGLPRLQKVHSRDCKDLLEFQHTVAKIWSCLEFSVFLFVAKSWIFFVFLKVCSQNIRNLFQSGRHPLMLASHFSSRANPGRQRPSEPSENTPALLTGWEITGEKQRTCQCVHKEIYAIDLFCAHALLYIHTMDFRLPSCSVLILNHCGSMIRWSPLFVIFG